MASEQNFIDTALSAQKFNSELIEGLKEKISKVLMKLGKDVIDKIPDDHLKGLETILETLPNLPSLLENFKDNLLELIILFLFQKKPMDDSKGQQEKLIKFMSEAKSPELLTILERIFITQLWNFIPKPPSMFAGFSYRSADGSDYSRFRFYSSIGKAGSQYSRSARIQIPFHDLPKADVVFDKVMMRNAFRPHPSGISATLFYLATVITLDLFNSRSNDPKINLNSSYLDLSPLYGSDAKEQSTVRLFKHGLLKPDTFVDSRALLQPPGVGSLLILFSRNHNYIADRLLKINKDGRFKDSSPQQDEDLFQTARLINCGYYLKIILRNYIRTILGIDQTNSNYYIDPTKPYDKSWLLQTVPTGIGNQVSLEFNYIYRWHPALAEKDVTWVEEQFKKVLEISDPNLSVDTFRQKVAAWAKTLPENPSEWNFGGMKRKDGKFQDSDIANVLIDGTEKVAGAFGAYGIPQIFRVIEIAGIETARSLGVCSLNDFRRFLNLLPYDSFEHMTDNNLELANDLKELYGDVENVELYPGLMTEKTKPATFGSAFAHPFTIGRAILTDAINLVRNDRFFSDDFNQHNLAYWDWDELNSGTEDLASVGILHQLILKHVPNIYKNNSVWALYPFTTPDRTKEVLTKRELDLSKFDFDRPKI